MKQTENQQHRVLGRILAQNVDSDYANAALAAGGTLPTQDSGSAANTYTANPNPLLVDVRWNNDWPTRSA